MTHNRRLTAEESEQLIERYAPLVRSVALTLLRKLPPSAAFDDLMQDGYLGLLTALLQATRHDAEGQFRSYLAQRVRGAMIDGLRRMDPGDRRVRREMRRVEQAIAVLCNELGRQPSEQEVATALDMPLPDYQQLLQRAHDYTLLSLEDFDDDNPDRNFVSWCVDTGSDPLAALQRRALQRRLLIAISDLSERENFVMTAYYVEEQTMTQIAARLSLTEGRISQIRAQAVARLRAAVLDEAEAPSPLRPRWRTAG